MVKREFNLQNSFENGFGYLIRVLDRGGQKKSLKLNSLSYANQINQVNWKEFRSDLFGGQLEVLILCLFVLKDEI